MSQKIEEAVTKGLLAGYGGKTGIITVKRGPFELKSSEFAENGINYIDQWLPRDTGGGQELVRIDEEEFTRLYAGGVVDSEKLKKLGITGKDIIGHLIQRISTLGADTRLFADCHPEIQNGWQYDYRLMESEPEIGVSVAKETIKYNDQLVFVHYFLLCGVR